MRAGAKIRVLVVDDSAIVRKVLTSILEAEPDIEVAGTAPDPFVARDKILSLKPDVLTLDIEMPRMDGLTFLEKIMRHRPLPVIMISSLAQSSARASLEAMARGAVDVLAKPGGPYSVGDLKGDLPHRVRAAASANLRRNDETGCVPPQRRAGCSPSPGEPGDGQRGDAGSLPARAARLVALGASTGGTVAIEQILRPLPADMPPMVIAQHIPAGFSAAFAERLNKVCAVEVREARHGDRALPGVALLAPGNQHMRIRQNNGGWSVELDGGPKVCYQRPSVDVLFESVAAEAGVRSAGVILTGMGSDGASGLLRLRQAGARTVAQDEATCVVFGMPREAIRLGAAEMVLPVGKIAQHLLELCRPNQT